ncbi:hypothetical protein FHS13_004282 [Nocardiopsis algeriensis]|uniref:Uncharacterized protein n=1 Tax=Nocardiopsis algeriensis TaxID=1478215 RepID=A0A841IVU6_9ACTN|nr:hypothetical protein [Nocardiopsis algeriensis]
MEAFIPGKDESHGSTIKKHPDELCERSTRMDVDTRRDPVVHNGAIAHSPLNSCLSFPAQYNEICVTSHTAATSPSS